MIRKAVIVVLTAAATVTATALVWSIVAPYSETYETLPRMVYGVFPRAPALRCRINLVAGRAYFRYPFLVDAERPFTPIDKDIGGCTIRFTSTRSRSRIPGGAGGVVYGVHDTPEERAERNRLESKKLLYLEILRFPLWVPLLLFAAYPAVACYRGPLRRYRRRRGGLCVTCGYNLTGNVSGVCPECGEEVERG